MARCFGCSGPGTGLGLSSVNSVRQYIGRQCKAGAYISNVRVRYGYPITAIKDSPSGICIRSTELLPTNKPKRGWRSGQRVRFSDGTSNTHGVRCRVFASLTARVPGFESRTAHLFFRVSFLFIISFPFLCASIFLTETLTLVQIIEDEIVRARLTR